MRNPFYPFLVSIEKRIRLAISVLLAVIVFFISTFFFFDQVFIFVPILCIAAYIATYISVLEGIEKIEWVMLFIMPIVMTISFYFFYFLIPIRWITRVPMLLFFGVSIYAQLLISNIFNVGAEKSLQLYRAAFSVNYLYQSVILFLSITVLTSFKLSFYWNGVIVFCLIAILALQLLWSIKLDHHLEKQVVKYAHPIPIFI